MQLKVWPSTANFNLMSTSPTPISKVVLNRVLLRICKVTVNPTEQWKKPADEYRQVPLHEGLTHHKSHQSTADFCQYGESVSGPHIPAKLCVGLLSIIKYNGRFNNNLFEFKSANLNYLVTYVNGISMPRSPFEPYFSTDNYIREYLNMFTLLFIYILACNFNAVKLP